MFIDKSRKNTGYKAPGEEVNTMKKIFALMLALCLMLGCTALAEEPTELNWADVEAAAKEVGGQFIPIDLGLAVWAPNDYYVLSELN